MIEDAIGIFFGILIGFCGVLILIFPTRRYWKIIIHSLFSTTYTVTQYNNKHPNNGAIKGTIHTQNPQQSPLSGQPCATYKIKERTRNYHSSGASKLTTKDTYHSTKPFKLTHNQSTLKIHTDVNTELRLQNTRKQKVKRGDPIPKSLQKHRNNNTQTITANDYTQTTPLTGLRNVQFIEKRLEPNQEIWVIFKNKTPNTELTPENILLITDRNPHTAGLRLLPLTIFLTLFGLFCTYTGYLALTGF